MLRVEAGEKLPERLLALPAPSHGAPFNGWAVETRVYAEDPLRGFLPSIGQLTACVLKFDITFAEIGGVA